MHRSCCYNYALRALVQKPCEYNNSKSLMYNDCLANIVHWSSLIHRIASIDLFVSMGYIYRHNSQHRQRTKLVWYEIRCITKYRTL